MSEMTKAFLTSESQLWATPWPVINALSEEFNFTLDVAASATSAKCLRFFTEENDAFKQDWLTAAAGGDAFCNPPYGDEVHPVSDWAQEAWSYRSKLNTVLLLPANKTDQDWFHDLVVKDGEYRPVRGRIQFVDPVTGLVPRKKDPKTGKMVMSGNSQGSMLCIFGPHYVPGWTLKSFDYKAAMRKYQAKVEALGGWRE